MKILFLYGWQSVPGGVKPTYLKDHGHEVINPALDDDDFNAALSTAQAEFDQHRPQVVVGSSRGGAVAMNIDSGGAKLVLLCPAWKKWGTARTVKPDTVILHSRGDEGLLGLLGYYKAQRFHSFGAHSRIMLEGQDRRKIVPDPVGFFPHQVPPATSILTPSH